MIELCLHNALLKAGIDKKIISLITPVLVSAEDEAFQNPTKPIGSFYTKEEAEKIKQIHKAWIIKEDKVRGFRRVVPSPIPLEIINKEVIKKMVNEGYIVIAAGGGGIPVIHREDGTLKGVPAVIDKNRTAAILGRDIGADTLMILTAVDKVYLNYGSEKQKGLDAMTIGQARRYLGKNHFPEGSMGPKIEAAITFLEQGGKEVIICALKEPDLALTGNAGTKIIKDK